MSFMFNPHPYDDPTALNRLTDISLDGRIFPGNDAAMQALVASARKALDSTGKALLCLDGYPGAPLNLVAAQLAQAAEAAGFPVLVRAVSDCYKTAEELDALLAPYLPEDIEKDPVQLYGQLFQGGYADLMSVEAVAAMRRLIGGETGLVVLCGHGASSEPFQGASDLNVWIDVTPKDAVLLAKAGKLANLGDAAPEPFRQVMRRAYYVDFVLSEELRGRLLHAGKIDYYACAHDPDTLTLLSGDGLDAVLGALARQPFRCRPVYIEGVWGGQYIKKIRKLPDAVRNVAWSFDMIPLEVSIVADACGHTLEFPFHTFVQKEGRAIMGAAAQERFGGYFPVRFNYDDTWHSSGNMSIQVHPGEEYVKENFKDFGRQDESYYIVATGHGAKTYCGFHDGADVERFLTDVKRSERESTPVDHDAYVNSIPSRPGMQFMLPAGTIHASGRNQLILEIGSLTMGSYTFKLYDYLRLDLDGIPRPIHSWHGERVLNSEFRSGYVSEKLVHAPRIAESGDGYAEEIVGECDQLYFSLRRLCFERSARSDTEGQFHVLVLVDGEKVTVRSASNSSLCYSMRYLDMVVVPASVGAYEMINEGSQPVVMHKTRLK